MAKILGWWAIVNLTFGGISFGEGLYLSQIMLILMVAFSLLQSSRRRIGLTFASLGAMLLFFVTQVYLSGAVDNSRFLPEFAKMLLLLLGGVAIGASIQWTSIDHLARLFPPFLTLLLILVWFIGLGDYYGDDGRFGIPWLGSPNATGFVIAVGLAFHMYKFSDVWRLHKGSLVLLDITIGITMVIFLFATQSLGGIGSSVVVVLRFLGVRTAIILYGLLGLFIFGILCIIWIPGLEMPELIGSGRLIIWQMLLSKWIDADNLHRMVGMGPGAIDLNLWFTASVQSAHSMYVEVLYAYGIVGLCMFAYALVYIGGCIYRYRSLDKKKVLFLEAVFLALTIGFWVDTYLMSAQLTWLGALLIGMHGLTKSQLTSRQVIKTV